MTFGTQKLNLSAFLQISTIQWHSVAMLILKKIRQKAAHGVKPLHDEAMVMANVMVNKNFNLI